MPFQAGRASLERAVRGQQVADLSRVEDLQRAITTLYHTFAGYPLHEVIEGCEHCVPLTDQIRLRTTPLRALTVQDLTRFLISNCILTWGGAVELKHFLPRLCELIALHAPDERQRLSPEILGNGTFTALGTISGTQRDYFEADCNRSSQFSSIFRNPAIGTWTGSE